MQLRQEHGRQCERLRFVAIGRPQGAGEEVLTSVDAAEAVERVEEGGLLGQRQSAVLEGAGGLLGEPRGEHPFPIGP